ncbi:MAG: GlpG protein [Halioglobus sp.]|jgi:GlpG protein
MSFRFTALKLAITEDLLPLSAVLQQRGVSHRIYEEGGQQVLKVDREAQVEEVVALYEGWRSGQLRIDRVDAPPGSFGGTFASRVNLSWTEAPLTIALIVFSLMGFAVWYFNIYGWLDLLAFSSLGAYAGSTSPEAFSGQYWRLITPVFLHLGWLHIVFNSLWLWELGSKLERGLGSVNLFFLFCTIAVVSNTGQFLFGGPGQFGGMSGVVYGLLGFSWVGPQIQTQWRFEPPRTIMIFMILWLLFCMTGLVGAIANAAHLGGLMIGALLGAAFGLLSRLSEDKA